MLQLNIPATELWDNEKSIFIYVEACTICLEHSLVSVSKWESKWMKPFMSKQSKTYEEVMDYVRCMTVTQNVDSNVYRCLTQDHVDMIRSYIESPMTATTVPKDTNNKSNREIVTAELVYYWMIALNIPFECQYWHFNRLLMLIKVCNIKNTPPKKKSKREIMAENRALNAARRKKLNSRG